MLVALRARPAGAPRRSSAALIALLPAEPETDHLLSRNKVRPESQSSSCQPASSMCFLASGPSASMTRDRKQSGCNRTRSRLPAPTARRPTTRPNASARISADRQVVVNPQLETESSRLSMATRADARPRAITPSRRSPIANGHFLQLSHFRRFSQLHR